MPSVSLCDISHVLCTAKAILNCMQIRMTQVQDLKQQILFITGLNMRTKCSITMYFTKSVLLKWLMFEEMHWKALEKLLCVTPTTVITLYDSCLESILQSLLSSIFPLEFQKNSVSNPSIPSQVWSVTLLYSLTSFSHLSQYGPPCQASPLKRF